MYLTTTRTFCLTQGQPQPQRLQVFGQKLFDKRVRVLVRRGAVLFGEGKEKPAQGRGYFLDHQRTHQQSHPLRHLHCGRVYHCADQILVGENKRETESVKCIFQQLTLCIPYVLWTTCLFFYWYFALQYLHKTIITRQFSAQIKLLLQDY